MTGGETGVQGPQGPHKGQHRSRDLSVMMDNWPKKMGQCQEKVIMNKRRCGTKQVGLVRGKDNKISGRLHHGIQQNTNHQQHGISVRTGSCCYTGVVLSRMRSPIFWQQSKVNFPPQQSARLYVNSDLAKRGWP